MCPFLDLAPLVKCVCMFVLAGGGGSGGRRGSKRCLGCSLALEIIKDSAASFNSRNNSLNRDSVI